MSVSSAMEAALRLLTARDRSTADLTARLQRRGFDPDSIEQALSRCRELGYLDDARFARSRAKSLLKNGRAVGPRLLLDLRQKGVTEETARRALDELQHETDERQILQETLQRRFADFNFATAEDRQRRRVVNFFLRRGFALTTILDTLKKER